MDVYCCLLGFILETNRKVSNMLAIDVQDSARRINEVDLIAHVRMRESKLRDCIVDVVCDIAVTPT